MKHKRSKMEQKDFEEYFATRYLDAVKSAEFVASWSKRQYYFFQFLIILCASLIPIFTIISFHFLSAVAGLVILVAMLLINIFRLDSTWKEQKLKADALKRESSLFTAGLSEYEKCDDKCKLFVERVENILE